MHYQNKPNSLIGRLLIDKYERNLPSANKYYKQVVLRVGAYRFLQKMRYIMVSEMALTKITPLQLQFLPN